MNSSVHQAVAFAIASECSRKRPFARLRNRAGENRPGDIRRNHFVYTCVGTRVSTHVSTRVGAFVWDYNTEKANFCGHSRVHLCEHSREHLREPFRGSIGGSYFAFASSVLH